MNNPGLAAYEPFRAEAVRRALSTSVLGRTLHLLDETASTNQEAYGLAQSGAADGTVVIAEMQTAGRGRLGRRWHSPPGKNLYCSVILRRAVAPDALSGWLAWVPLLCGLGVARAIQRVAGSPASVKWPNDVLIGDRKVAGILCESGGAATAAPFVIIGIGINVNTPMNLFPDELRGLATSLAAEAGKPIDRVALLATLLSELEIRYGLYCSNHLADLRDEYRVRSSTLGRRVRIELAHGETVEGLAQAVNEDGSLRLVKGGQGNDHLEVTLDIRAGDVVHLRKDVAR
jgi:BirA family transcriptional regulator, biotin operon repressor / biotin---[acetyl-CoA-carboxylase] ligase